MKMHLSGSRARRGKKSRSSQLNDRNLGRVVQRILEIEALETRLLLSGIIATGKRKVTFHDGDGDRVTVSLTGPRGATFDIDAASGNIDSILIRGGTASSVLSISVAPVKVHGPVVGVTPSIYSDAVVTVGEIEATGTTALRGIALSGAIVYDINLPGVTVGSIGLNPGKAPIIDRIMTTVTGSFPAWDLRTPDVDFHTITVGSITGSISLSGVGAAIENFDGAITATTGGIHSIIGLNSNLTSTVSAATNIDRIQVLGAAGADISTTTGNLTLNVGNGGIPTPASVISGGDLNLTVSGGGLNGTFIAGGHLNLGVGGLGIGQTAATLLQAGNGISGSSALTTDAIRVIGGISDTTFHALGGNIANLTAVGRLGIDNSNVIADTGNIGVLTADNFDTVYVSAQMGSIGGVNAHTATANYGVGYSTFHAGTDMGPINVQNDRQGGVGIYSSSFRADGAVGFGAITVKVNGGPGATGIEDSEFSTAGDFTGAITATAAGAGGTTTNDAIHGSLFSAAGSFLGGISVPQGNITGSTFLAGYDIGPNQTINGTFTATSDDRVGADTASPTFTSITVGNGNVINSIFASGVTPGTDATFGDANDNLNAALATIGVYSVTGSTTGSTFESATIFPMSFSQVFSGNTVRAFTGNIGDITINGSFPNMNAFAGNTITADLGSIGNVFVRNSSLVGLDAINGNTLTAKTGVGDIIGITDGIGDGISGLTVDGDSSGRGLGSVGSIIGVGANGGEPSLDGINNLTANGDNVGMTLSAAATAFLTANLSAAVNTDVTALLGSGGVVGYTLGTGFGIDTATVTALTSVGNVAGVVNSAYGRAGLFGVDVYAGVSIGNITGTTIANGTKVGGGAWPAIAGIVFSNFYANAGKAATAGGTGTIGNVVGSSVSTAAVCDHNGISMSGFYAGGGTGGTGTIGTVTGTGTATGAAVNVDAYGILSTAIKAGSGAGATGTIGDVTGTGTATSTTGNATAGGIYGGTMRIEAGVGAGNGTGTIGNIVGTGTATGVTGADAYGISAGKGISAGSGAGGVGTIGNLTGTATATATGFTAVSVDAYGIYSTTINAASGGLSGTIGNVSGTATGTATSTGSGVAVSLDAYGIYSSTLNAGTGAGGVGTIGNVSGTATGTATSTGLSATVNVDAYGVYSSTLNVGTGTAGGVGTIGTVTATGTATGTANGAGSSANVDGYGVYNSTFSAGGTGTGSVGTLASGGITATGSATAISNTQADAHAAGIDDSTFNAAAGGLSGAIGAINATATTVATSVNTTTSGNDTHADAWAIDGTFTAGTGTGGVGTIGTITAAATGTATAVGDDAEAYGYGVGWSTFSAGGTGTGSSGTIGTITAGTGAAPVKATATSVTGNTYATAYGIYDSTFKAASGGLAGTIGAIGTATLANATATDATKGNANVSSQGIAASTFTAGTAAGATGGVGHIADAGITVSALGNATANGGYADTVVRGITGDFGSTTAWTAGGAGTGGNGTIAGSGTIGVTVYGSARSTGDYATVVTRGINTQVFNANTSGIAGTIGAISITGGGTGGVSALATTASANDNAYARVDGIRRSDFYAANGAAGVGTIAGGGITASVIAQASNTATTATGTGVATARAFGLRTSGLSTGNNTAGGTGTIGAITMTANATAANSVTAPVAGGAVSRAEGISAGQNIYAGHGSTSVTVPGIGTIGNISATANATTTVVAATGGTHTADAIGIGGSYIQAGSDGLATKGVGTIGNISGTAVATDSATASAANAYGISYAVITSGAMDGTAAGAGTIGNISGSATGVSDSVGLLGVVAQAATGIGNISGTSAGATLTDGVGIVGSLFQADGGTTGLVGTIGTITASTVGTNAISASLFSSIQGIGAITVSAGNVTGSQFVAGISFGTLWASEAGRNNATSAATIGNVSIAGAFISSDLIAGVDSGAGNIFGRDAGGADALLIAGSGTIGTVTIGLPVTAFCADGDILAANHGAIESFAMGTVTVGAVVLAPDQIIDNDSSGIVVATAGDVRVRTI